MILILIQFLIIIMKKYCKYFNKYNNSISELLNTLLKVIEYYNYEELILQEEDDNIKI